MRCPAILETRDLPVSSKFSWELFDHRCVCLALRLHIWTLLILCLCPHSTFDVEYGADWVNCNTEEKYHTSSDLVTNIGY